MPSWGDAIVREARKNPHVKVLGMVDKVVTPALKKLRKAERTAKEDWLFEEFAKAGLPTPEREYYWHPTRRFRADFCWPDQKVIVEYQGGGHMGAHQRRGGYDRDRDRSNQAQLEGFTIIEVTPEMARDIAAVCETVRRALEARGA